MRVICFYLQVLFLLTIHPLCANDLEQLKASWQLFDWAQQRLLMDNVYDLESYWKGQVRDSLIFREKEKRPFILIPELTIDRFYLEGAEMPSTQSLIYLRTAYFLAKSSREMQTVKGRGYISFWRAARDKAITQKQFENLPFFLENPYRCDILGAMYYLRNADPIFAPYWENAWRNNPLDAYRKMAWCLDSRIAEGKNPRMLLALAIEEHAPRFINDLSKNEFSLMMIHYLSHYYKEYNERIEDHLDQSKTFALMRKQGKHLTIVFRKGTFRMHEDKEAGNRESLVILKDFQKEAEWELYR